MGVCVSPIQIMDWVIGLLILCVGTALGALVALLFDNVYWGRQLKSAVSLQQKFKTQYRQAIRHVAQLQARGQQRLQALRLKSQEAEELSRRTIALSSELTHKGEALETAVSDLQLTQANLTRLGEHSDQLRRDNDAWEAKYTSSEQTLMTIRTQLHNTHGELTAVRQEKDTITEKLLTTSAKLQSMDKLRDKLATKETELETLNREKATLEASLTQAMTQVEKLNVLAAALREQEAANRALQAEKNAATEALSVAQADLDVTQAALVAVQADLDTAKTDLDAVQTSLVAAQADRDAAQAEQQMVQNEVFGLRRRASEGAHTRKRLTAVSQELTAAKEEIELLKSKLVAQNHIKKSVLHDKDNLTIIRGIGPAYARRLNEAGVTSLIDLAKMTPDRVGEIVGVQNWQSRNVQAWIDEAQSLIASFAD